MITLGTLRPPLVASASQREIDRVTGRHHSDDEEIDLSELGGNGNENPRRFFRRAVYLALGGLITWGITTGVKAGAEATIDGVRAEVALHHTVADHTKMLTEHDQVIRELRAQLLPAPTANRLIELLEADRKAREGGPKGRSR